jgi:hypothetical protein
MSRLLFGSKIQMVSFIAIKSSKQVRKSNGHSSPVLKWSFKNWTIFFQFSNGYKLAAKNGLVLGWLIQAKSTI